MTNPNSFGSRATLEVGGRNYTYFRLDSLNSPSGGNASRLPFSLKILLENLLRNEDGNFVKAADIESLAKWALKDPLTIQVGIRRAPSELVDHALYPVANAQKFELLHELLERTHYQSVIVFCRMKSGADMVAAKLLQEGHKVVAMHSDRSQKEREEALLGFREGKYEVLVATDIASRGLDIAGVTHVINYDVPQHPEDYVHRIGRTGRALTEGDAFTLFTSDDMTHVQAIERFIARPIQRKRLENFKYTYTVLLSLKDGEDLPKMRVAGGRVGSKGYSFAPARR